MIDYVIRLVNFEIYIFVVLCNDTVWSRTIDAVICD